MGIMAFLKEALSLFAALFGFLGQRSQLNNAADMKARLVQQRAADARAEISEALQKGKLDVLRKALAT